MQTRLYKKRSACYYAAMAMTKGRKSFRIVKLGNRGYVAVW